MIYLLYFLSGVSALTYQVLWLRLLSHVFGVTAYAAGTVLATFMGGLAIGSLVGGRLAARVSSPLAAFGLVELCIGVTAFATPQWLDGVRTLYVATHDGSGSTLSLLIRVVASAGVLLVPTSLMGATLPLIAKAADRGGAIGRRLPWLYGANTAGAITGALATGFVLIGGIGITRTLQLAALTNVGVGAVALWANRTAASPPAEGAPIAAPKVDARSLTPLERWSLIVGVTISGFAALALEVVWFRVLVLFLEATSYAFSTMLATVLGSLAVGSLSGGAFFRRRTVSVTVVGGLMIAIAIVAPLSIALLAYLYQTGWQMDRTAVSSVAIFPAATLMGAAFPLVLRIWTDQASLEAAGRARGIGLLNGLNLLGAIAGAICGTFVLMPLLGSRGSVLLLSALYLAAGALLIEARSGAHRTRRHIGLVSVFAGLWAVAILTPDPVTAVIARRHPDTEAVVFREEGAQATVSVHRIADGNNVLYIDGMHQANDTLGMLAVHRIIGHLPMLLHPDPRHALVIGLGGGATAGAVSQHGAQLDIVELSPAVARAARRFGPSNYYVLDQPTVRLIFNDGRNHLLFARSRYDVITADIIQPDHAGAGALYSIDYFRRVREALKDDGLMLQWIGGRPPTEYKLLLRTFLTAFPEATLWNDGGLLVGSKQPLRVSVAAVERQLSNPALHAALALMGLSSVDQLRAQFTAGPDEMLAFAGRGILLSDDRPLLEFHRSLPSGEPPVVLSYTGRSRNVFVP